MIIIYSFFAKMGFIFKISVICRLQIIRCRLCETFLKDDSDFIKQLTRKIFRWNKDSPFYSRFPFATVNISKTSHASRETGESRRRTACQRRVLLDRIDFAPFDT